MGVPCRNALTGKLSWAEHEENATVNATGSMTVTATATVLPTETTLVEPKSRVGPTVTLHPVNDVVDKSQAGLVEHYMDNIDETIPE